VSHIEFSAGPPLLHWHGTLGHKVSHKITSSATSKQNNQQPQQATSDSSNHSAYKQQAHAEGRADLAQRAADAAIGQGHQLLLLLLQGALAVHQRCINVELRHVIHDDSYLGLQEQGIMQQDVRALQ
jgi:hypothetical protein